MMLADSGAEVIRIDRAGGLGAGVAIDGEKDVMLRSRRTISLDLKRPAAIEIVRRLCATADGLIEGFRPGVTERLGLGPADLQAINPSLVYGRMTGWGQTGPNAAMAGHDINYLAVSGVLDTMGAPGGIPVPPLNLLGDYAGGGMLLAFGMTSAILSVKMGGQGRVIDCAMVDGASALMAGIWSLRHNAMWNRERGENLLDGGAPFYAVYRTSDDRFAAIGAIEHPFYQRLCQLLDLAGDPDFADQHDQARWPVMRDKLAARFSAGTLQEFEQLFAGEDVCFAPVVPMAEAPSHPHNRARGAFIETDGLIQPAPAPRYANSAAPEGAMWQENRDRDALLAELGYSPEAVADLARTGIFGSVAAAQSSDATLRKREAGVWST
jgi:alpha-methylacyl-CoA racemase